MKFNPSEIQISYKREDINFEFVFSFLKRTYWGKHYKEGDYLKALESSYVCSIFDISKSQKQIGFARIISDGVYYGYLADVFLLEEFRGRGLGLYFLNKFLESDDIKHIRRIALSTNDAFGLYKKLGFKLLRFPDNQMELLRSSL